MAKFKKSSKKTASAGSASAQAERFSKSLSESAQQVWLAGVGAFGRAQAEGAKLFETLVKEGINFEQTARKFAGGSAYVMRDVVENRVGQARERATDTWDRLEKVFEDRVQRALNKLGVPGRDDLNDLARRVETLTSELRKQAQTASQRAASTKSERASRKAAPKKTPAKQSANKRASKAASAKSATHTTRAAKKTPAKRVRKSATVPHVARPDSPESN